MINMKKKGGNDMTLDEAIKHAEEVADYDAYGEKQCKCAEEHRQLAEWLKDYKRLLEQEPKWTPVSEGLPKKTGNYLITNSFDIGSKEPVREVHKDYFSVSSQKWLYRNEEVVAWMPLPEPYKAERRVHKMSNLEKAKEIVKEYYRVADYGIFDNRNTEGHKIETIYEGEGLIIDICYYHSYIEVFGLSESDFKELEKYYNSLVESGE